jgi:2-dehydro-3-deoxy-D-arabinonate dehydratase
MEIVRYVDRQEGALRVGVRRDSRVTPIVVDALADLWSTPASELPAVVGREAGASRSLEEVIFLPPVDGHTEVWAAGVTYERSRVARQEESSVASVYELVYDADRPELFFKSVAWRVVTDEEPVAIRQDSELNVPEAELAVVINAHGEIVGYTVCNDMSSRSIEGENPLYLPQAKLYAGSCAIGSGIRPVWEVPDPGHLVIDLTVMRHGAMAWQGSTSTAALYRKLDDLVTWLFAEQSFPAGVILSTGTGVVPEMDFTLRPGDVVRIAIDQIGTLSNPVLSGKESFSWLSTAASDPMAREALRLHRDRSRVPHA